MPARHFPPPWSILKTTMMCSTKMLCAMHAIVAVRSRAVKGWPDVRFGSKAQLATQCPLYPQKRTSFTAAGMSALCHERTHAVQQSIEIYCGRYCRIFANNCLGLKGFVT
jgi:hypothetical protein